ncbi:MAG: tyrosine--tRNA ligase, partial [Brevinema sp.]
MLSVDEQLNIIKKGVVDLLPEEDLINKLKKKQSLKIKLGADPSAPDLHLGHAVILRKLRQLQDLGHQVIFIIGDFTAMIGDPTGKSETRKPLDRETVLINAETYKQQLFKILDPKKTEILFNSAWLDSLTFADMIRLTSRVTVAQLLERDDFSKRFKEHRPISLVEFMYPLAQAYDSVVLEADLEAGGTDQKFNLLFGRALQQALGHEPQCIITMPIIEGLDGVQKMSKSLNNYIGLTDTPENMFGKIMSIPDHLLEKYFELLTDVDIDTVKKRLASGENPRDLKVELGKNIVECYHSHSAADQALAHFEN